MPYLGRTPTGTGSVTEIDGDLKITGQLTAGKYNSKLQDIINGNTEKSNTFPDVDVVEAFLFQKQLFTYGVRNDFNEERQLFRNNHNGGLDKLN